MNAQNYKLDPVAAVCLVIGSILGSGVFIAPGLIAAFSPSSFVALGFWIVGGIVCAIGASVYGSLALRFPGGGGQYVYMKEIFGYRTARFYGWVSTCIICPTMLASSALFLAEQFRAFVALSDVAVKLIACSTIVVFTLFNIRGIHLAGVIQKQMVFVQVGLFLGVTALAAYFLPGGQLLEHPTKLVFADLSLTKGILAMAVVLWSFEGFNAASFITNEIDDGERNARRVGLWGCAVVMVLYAVYNYVVFHNVPPTEMQKHTNSAAALMSMAFGSYGAAIVFALTAIGIATTLHASVIIGPRITSATAEDSKVAHLLSARHPVFGSPNRALWFQCLAVIVYLWVGHFSALVTCFIVLNWLFYGVTVFGFLKLVLADHRAGTLGRFYLAEVFAGAFFLLMVVVLLTTQFLENTALACLGVVVFLLGTIGSGLLEDGARLLQSGARRAWATARLFLT